MCLLWVLLQFVCLAIYWDVPPISSEGGAVMVEMKQEEANEEEAPLMGSDEEPVHTYRAVSCSEGKTSANDGASGVSSPFRKLSAGRGEQAGLTDRQKRWLSVPRSSGKRCHCQCTCFLSAALSVLHAAHTNTHARTNTHAHSPGLWGILCDGSDPLCIDWTCVFVSGSCHMYVCVYIYDVRYPIGLVSK